ncbi:MAG: hypothetical protein JST89_01505 [Cyanobacteria bacterium SZAS-4]|nr:hypothetical protein [Cyanobacteria bacterium SZAS-4]
MPAWFGLMWVGAVISLFTASSPIYLFPYFLFLTVIAYLMIPFFIHNFVQICVQRHIQQRDYESIDRAYSKTLMLLNKLRLRNGGVRTFLLAEIGRMRLMEGHFDSAESFFLEAIASTVNEHRTPPVNRAILYFNLAGSLRRQGLLPEASDRYEMGMKFLTSTDAKTLAFLSYANLAIAALKTEQGDLAGAEQCLIKAKELMDRTDLQKAFPSVRKIQAELSCLSALTLVLLRKGDQPAAEIIGRKFLSLANLHLGEITSLELKTLNQIAAEYLALGQNELAEKFLEVTYAVARDFPFHPDSPMALDSFEKLLLITGRKAEVDDMRHWLRPVHDGSIDLLERKHAESFDTKPPESPIDPAETKPSDTSID